MSLSTATVRHAAGCPPRSTMSHYPAKKKSRSGSGSGSGSGSRSDPPSRAKSGSKPGSKPSSKGSNPDDWCEWERDEQWPREWRSRQNPDGACRPRLSRGKAYPRAALCLPLLIRTMGVPVSWCRWRGCPSHAERRGWKQPRPYRGG